MKIPTSLLQAILVGVTIGATTTSCSMLDPITGSEEEVCEEFCRLIHEHVTDETSVCWECHDCGMG